jgi:hypothetical protein
MTSKTIIQTNHVFLSEGNQNASDQKANKNNDHPVENQLRLRV